MAKDKAPLLGELEALQAVLLNTAGIDPSSIPLLEDIIESGPSVQQNKLEYRDENYVHDSEPAFNSSSTTDYPRQNNLTYDDDFAHELFIQDLIDTMMPGIEAELRKRLLKLDKNILEHWYQQTHSNR